MKLPRWLRARFARNARSIDGEVAKLDAELHVAMELHREGEERIKQAADDMVRIAAESLEIQKEQADEP